MVATCILILIFLAARRTRGQYLMRNKIGARRDGQFIDELVITSRYNLPSCIKKSIRNEQRNVNLLFTKYEYIGNDIQVKTSSSRCNSLKHRTCRTADVRAVQKINTHGNRIFALRLLDMHYVKISPIVASVPLGTGGVIISILVSKKYIILI